MSIYRLRNSPFYQYDFQIDGHRFHGSTKARNKHEAKQVERDLKERAKADIEQEKRFGHGPMTLRVACGRYWQEVGQLHRNSKDTWRHLRMITEFIGPDKRIDEISDGEVAALIASRRQQQIVRPRKKPKKEALTRFASNSTINRTAVVPLKAVLVRARRTWKVPLPKEPNWKDHWQKMPEERVRELQPMEAEALDGSVRSDYADWFEFARVTGLRRNETLLRWSNVNEIGRQIVTIGKRDRKVVTPITPTVKSILDRCRGHHPEFVFTYICKRPKGDQKKGARYPITPEGAKTEWRRLSKRSGVTDFRFHDIRHDVATKVLRRTGKLPMVQKVLSHANIATTARYAHILDEEVADALEENAKSQKKSQTKTKNAA